ncbi:hypothetical protein AB833_28775 [Chromatiales bacterium (ex Bugula neritina AB1)]|nr:hypothetical protein AB833_28775 [Chromatiales bacterium (ex Bugula neritina AB1)]
MNDTGSLEDKPVSDSQFVLLSGSVLIIAACSLVYELLISSLSTYLLGSSVVHYSLTIGLFLFFMGVGAWMAQSIERNLVVFFIAIEVAIGAIGGVSALLLFAAYAWTEFYYPIMLLTIAAIGILVGMELPLLTRILEARSGLRKGISQVLTFDYLGALIASLLFPFLLLPYLGHLLTASAVGLVNLLVALIVAWSFRDYLRQWKSASLAGLLAAAVLLIASALVVNPASELFESALYEDPVIHTEQSRFQKLVLTNRGDDLRLYLDGNLQFSSIDEYRYHEVLVHLPMAFAKSQRRVLVIGGGDGLAARELLKYPTVESVTVVDLDSAVTNLARGQTQLKQLNNDSLSSPKVTVLNEDAWAWLAQQGDLYNVVIVDLPDPENEDVARLYSVAMYERIARRMAAGGVMITQATSPWFARRAFWSIGKTIEAVFEDVAPATVYVPSFGLWGFFVAANHPLDTATSRVFEGRFLNTATLVSVLTLPADLPKLPVRINHNHSLPIIEYYREGWGVLNNASEPGVGKGS